MTDAGSQPRGGGCTVQLSRPGVVKLFLSVRLALEFDTAKSDRNQRERGLPFGRVAEFDFESALVRIDRRKEYGEIRFVALGLIDGRVHAVCFTFVKAGIRVISLRKANKREVRCHEQSTAADR